MAFWSVVGWLMIVGAGVSLARRRRQGVDAAAAEQMVLELRALLAARHPDVLWRGLARGTLVGVIVVDGQEVPVPLQRFAAQLAAFPDAGPALVERLVEEVRSDALEEPEMHVFADVATAILPQVRRVEWLDGRGCRFGDSALVSRPLGADLVVCYVIDAPAAMTFVCRRHLELWGRSATDVDRLAIANLRRRTGTGRLRPTAGGAPAVVQIGDGYDAARVLLVDPQDADGLLLALPERDVLWLGAVRDDLASLMASNAEQCARSTRPLSDRVYRVERGSLQPMTDRS